MIQAIRARAVELAAPALAVILAAVSVMTASADDRTVLVAAGLVAVAGTIVALVLGWSALAWLAIALLGVCLAVPIATHAVAPWASVACGIGLFLLAELDSAAGSGASRGASAAHVDRLRVTYLVTVVVGSAVVGSFALVAAGLLSLGAAGELAGLAASVMTISVVLTLVNRLGASRAQ